MRKHFLPPTRFGWAVAWLLAIAGGVIQIVGVGDAGWWIGLALVAPLLVLVARRFDDKRNADSSAADGFPFAPPPP